MNTLAAKNEKSSVALSSVIAALFLTGIKLIVGIITGSLGIMAEAAHSGLDLVAAIVTLVAVRISDKPADQEHHYGHGKIENFSAFIETLLLLATCAWIIWEAVERLITKNVEVDASVWAFLVMIISIVVDVSRSRMLYRAARKHNSQALEADALHFSTDIWSSAVVILGLAGVRAAGWLPGMEYLKNADAVAALGVALIVIYVSVQLGIRTVEGLLDKAPAGLSEKIKAAVEATAHINDCHAVRVRRAGPYMFIDVHVVMDGTQTLHEAHTVTEEIEKTIQKIIPGADVTVHPEPLNILEAEPA